MSSLNMSMLYVLTNSFTLPDAYECPENMMKKSGARWPIFGTYLLVSGVLFLLLYLPCFLAIHRVKSRTPAYQLMFVIAILDITSIIISSLVSGVLAITGTFYCQYPLFFFINGSIGVCAWMTDCLACILLAIERCVEVNPRFFLAFLFGKRKFCVVMTGIVFYGFYSMMFIKPAIFNPDYSCYLFDPLIGKDPKLYPNFSHAANNLLVAISTTTLYFYLCYYLIFKFGYTTSMWLYKSNRQIILQGVILCFFHATAAILYEYMQFFYSPQWLIIIGHVIWQMSCGCLSIVYLTLNRTIRNSVQKMLIPKKWREKLGLHIGIEEHLAVEKATDGSKVLVNSLGVIVKFDNFFQT